MHAVAGDVDGQVAASTRGGGAPLAWGEGGDRQQGDDTQSADGAVPRQSFHSDPRLLQHGNRVEALVWNLFKVSNYHRSLNTARKSKLFKYS